ncbi:hypothetical protein GOP47_0026610 [Adiantum capillus-veneris]|nr:hypothetical protein GOP47_0026610 [Adiantum capillus-veneris]
MSMPSLPFVGLEADRDGDTAENYFHHHQMGFICINQQDVLQSPCLAGDRMHTAIKATPSITHAFDAAILAILLCMCCCAVPTMTMAQLTPDFYIHTCPSLESIVKTSMLRSTATSRIALQAVLRLFFHDCFVEGCDASILIASHAVATERDALPNRSLAGDGFRAISEAKALVEIECPGVVSCADILAIAARDAVSLASGSTWPVLKGRKDGMISLASRVENNLPGPNSNVDQLKALFRSKGLDIMDIVALSGAHTLGFAHCRFFRNRLYHFNATLAMDPVLDRQFAAFLRTRCSMNLSSDMNTVQALDWSSPFSFDSSYFSNLQAGKGLLASDEVLWTDSRTKGIVRAFAQNQASFFAAFASSMVKLGNVGVKMGSQGQIRKDCRAFNA